MSTDGLLDLAARRRELLRRRLAEAKLLETPAPQPESAGAAGTERPLSPAQQRMWSIQQLDPSTVGYNVTIALDIRGELDAGLLEQAVHTLVARHDILRTVYRMAGGDDTGSDPSGSRVVQVVQEQLPPAYDLFDVRDLQPPAREARTDALARAVAAQPFDLSADSPLRVRLIRTGDSTSTLVVVAHHIVWDDGTTAVFFGELMDTYQRLVRGEPVPAGRAAGQYADVAPGTADATDEAGLTHWRDRLDPLPALLDLPGISGGAGGAGQERSRPLRPGIGRLVRELARREGASTFMVLFAAVSALLHKHTGAGEFLVGAPVVNRDFPGADGIIGYLGNTIPLRAEVDPSDDFRTLLARSRATCAEAYAHQHVGLDDIAKAVQPQRVRDDARLFNVVLSLRSPVLEPFRAAGLGATRRHVPGSDARFDLTLAVETDGDDLAVEANYPAGDAADEQVRRLLEDLDRLLHAALTDPATPLGELDLLAPAERRQVLHTWNDTAAPAVERPLPDWFADQAARTPDALAVTVPGDPGAELTYAELNARANRLARHLAGRGIGPEDTVALAVPRSPAMMVAALGILKAGAAYVPVDPSYPAERVRLMLTDSRPGLLITTSPVAGNLPDEGVPRLLLDTADAAARLDALPATDLSDRDRTAPLRPDNPAYVIYTSGSTGIPKGVVVTHRALSNHLDWAVRRFTGLGGRTLLHSSVSFDFTVTPMYGTLLCGGVLELCEDGPDAIANATGPATFLKLTPSHLPLLPSVRFADSGPRTVVIAGEALHGESLADWRPPAGGTTDVINEYGPTETTVGATLFDITDLAEGAPPHGPVPIGRPVTNTRCYVLDRALRPVPAGVAGELYIGGTQLARGYLGRPGLTAARFVAAPFGEPGERLYRTGDRARWRADGSLEFIGRVDEQVKIRGFRVEPGEIEAVLARHPAVAQAVVVGRSDGPGGLYLAAYVVLSDPTTGDPTTGDAATDGAAGGVDGTVLREYLAGELPEHMVPAAVVVLDKLPLSPSGKADRRALPAPEFTAAAPAARKPSGETEQTLARLFAETLRLDEVGVADSFFEIGGDSILAIQLVSRARKAGLKLLPRDVFEHRTVESLATAVRPATQPQPAAAPDDPVGPVEPTPIMRSFAERGPLGDGHRMSLVLEVPPLEQRALVRVAQAVFDTHDALRARLDRSADRPRLTVRERGAVRADTVVRRVAAPAGPAPDLVAAELEAAAARLDPEAGVMAQLVWFDAGQEHGRLLLVVHHLVVDGVSLRILAEDLAAAWRAVETGGEPALPPVGTSLRGWSRGLTERAPSRAGELAHWREVLTGPDPLLGSRRPDPARDTWSTVRTLTVELDTATTEALLTTVPQAFYGAVDDVLLAGLGLAVAAWQRDRGVETPSLPVLMEGHGREESAVPGADLSRTVGWFTTQYPVRLDLTGIALDDAFAAGSAAGDLVKRVKENLRSAPDHGIGHGMLRYLDPGATELSALPLPQLGFNHLGRVDTGDGAWSIAPGGIGAAYDPDMPVPTTLVVNAVTEHGPDGPRLTAHWMYAGDLLAAADVQDLADRWRKALDAIAGHAAGPGAGGHTPSDLSLVSLDQAQLDALEAKWKKA
jgi:amino acid adenylation domain-containing protein/non-ribosomal peptide synthase protein (TIGR01720 family)